MSVVADVPALANDISAEFYVVGTKKFLLLSIMTLGLYWYYWHYQQWARYRSYHNEKLWPVARALFAIFFIHSLTSEIDHRLRKNRTPYAWSPGAIATAYVVLALASSIGNRLPQNVGPWLNGLFIVLVLPIAWLLLKVQRAANLACGQPNGESNQRLTGVNWLWLVLGAAFWALILFGLYVSVPT
ncbi:hypothetical protein DVJ77_09780 [Dyella tabacisoli]|uniref:DUF4234 domain-containing protein n=2 Tax=Dyella tabacisoli TaxID=2282381 RepID=A0A369UP22_9GAMM|nr:hypothetical protein DVJ77_09780 [Dyella tabacisoli]